MRICLVSPPFKVDEKFGKLKKVRSVEPPLGLAYIASVLERIGHKVCIIDAYALGLNVQKTAALVKSCTPDLVGITSTTPTYADARELAYKIKQLVDVPVVIGGPHATAMPLKTLQDGVFDIAVIGEGEITMKELVDCLEHDNPLNQIAGIAFRNADKIYITSKRPLIKDLDSLPFPAWHLLPPLDYYRPSPASYKRMPVATMITSRGCPYGCIFCDKSVFGSVYRARSPINVVDEIEKLKLKYRVREIKFWDDCLNLLPKRLLRICREIRNRKLDIIWSCCCRADLISKDLVKSMADAGCWLINFGIETGVQRLLDDIGKGMKLEDIRQAVKLVKEQGISVRGFFMLGLPGERPEDIEKTIYFAKTLDLDIAVFHVVIPFPGTELFRRAVESGEINPETTDFTSYSMFSDDGWPCISRTLNIETLKKYRLMAYRKFYLRPSYFLRMLSKLRSLEDLTRYTKAVLSILTLK